MPQEISPDILRTEAPLGAIARLSSLVECAYYILGVPKEVSPFRNPFND
jgi:hypothetical protein